MNFDNQHPMIMSGGKSVMLTRKRGWYLLEGKIQDARFVKPEMKSEMLVMPVEDMTTENLKEDAVEKSTPEPMEVTLPTLPEAEAVR